MKIYKKRIFSFFIFLFSLISLFLGVFLFVFSFSQKEISPPNPKNYAPSFWFDSEENYFPSHPLEFNYDNNLEEIPAKKAKERYDSLSQEEKLNHFTVFYQDHSQDVSEHFLRC